MLGTLSFTIMQFVDQLMVARLGTEALAAVGSSGLWSYILATPILGIVGCVATFASQSLGRGEREQCARYAWHGVYIALLIGLPVLFLWPLAQPLFEAMPHSPETTRLEIVYFRVRLLGYVFMAWQAALTAFFQSVNRPAIPMYAGIAANVVNVVFSYLLIFGKFGFPRWGVAGAAVATVLALALQALALQALFLSRAMNAAFGTRRAYGFDGTKIGELLRIGGPSGLHMFMDIANWGVFTSFLVGAFGTVQLAAHNAAINFMSLSFMPAVGLHYGITPIVGQWIGRGSIPTAKLRTYTAMRLAVGYMFLMGLIMGVFGKTLMRQAFSTDPEVIALGGLLLICAAVFQGFDAINIVAIGALRGAGDTRWMAIVTVVAAYGGFLPLAYYFAYPLNLGAFGAWIGATVYIIGLSGILFWRFHGERWRHLKIFAKDRLEAASTGSGAV